MKTELADINKYCGNVSERIRACRNAQIAHALKERLCSELASQCPSEMVQQILRRHIDQMIGSTFDRKGRNIYLENPE
jgi:hypothetical protein